MYALLSFLDAFQKLLCTHHFLFVKFSLLHCVFQQIWTLLRSFLKGLLALPFLDVCVMAADQHRRHFSVMPDRRTSILRIFQQSIIVTFFGKANFLGQYPRTKPSDCICNDQCTQLHRRSAHNPRLRFPHRQFHQGHAGLLLHNARTG